jgi:hypothetical protein
MAPRHALALELAELEVEPLQPVQLAAVQLEALGTGHGMTEVGASWSPQGKGCCSCCLACCCCCW